MIDLLVYIQETDTELRGKAKRFVPIILKDIAPDEKGQASQVQKKNAKVKRQAVPLIRQKAEVYGRSGAEGPSWAEKLLRQGIIERRLFINSINSQLSDRHCAMKET